MRSLTRYMKLLVLPALIALVLGTMSVGTGCDNPTTVVIKPELQVDRVVDQYGDDHDPKAVDLTTLPVGWKVRLVVVDNGSQHCDIKASAYDSKNTMSFGSFPANPTVGDEHYFNGLWYGYCRGHNGVYGWYPRLVGGCSITTDGADAAWVTFATTNIAMAVVVVATVNNETMGMPCEIGVDPDAKPSISFPAVTTIVIGYCYILNVTGNYAWRIPEQGISVCVLWQGVNVPIGSLTINSVGNLVVVFNEGLANIISSIPTNQHQPLTIVFVYNVTYTFEITVIGSGGGGGGDGVIVVYPEEA